MKHLTKVDELEDVREHGQTELKLWQAKYDRFDRRKLTADDVTQICRNLTGFFGILLEHQRRQMSNSGNKGNLINELTTKGGDANAQQETRGWSNCFVP